MKRFIIISLFLSCLVLSKLNVLAVNRIITFGDSLSCTGNACQYASNPANMCIMYPNGRFTDGDVWIEVLADELGLIRPKPSLIGGYNYAYGGATTGWEFSHNRLNVGHQIENYLQRVNRKADPHSLYILWAGGNDIKNNIGISSIAKKIIPKNLIPNLKQHITDLAKAGARTFCVPNFPPLAQTPLAKGATDILGFGAGMLGSFFDYNDVEIQQWVTDSVKQKTDSETIALNKELKKMLQDLERSLKITIYHFDVYTLFYEVQNNLYAYGLDHNDFLFYDGFHPNAAVHRILGEEAFQLVNKPKAKIKSKSRR